MSTLTTDQILDIDDHVIYLVDTQLKNEQLLSWTWTNEQVRLVTRCKNDGHEIITNLHVDLES